MIAEAVGQRTILVVFDCLCWYNEGCCGISYLIEGSKIIFFWRLRWQETDTSHLCAANESLRKDASYAIRNCNFTQGIASCERKVGDVPYSIGNMYLRQFWTRLEGAAWNPIDRNCLSIRHCCAVGDDKFALSISINTRTSILLAAGTTSPSEMLINEEIHLDVASSVRHTGREA